MYTGPHIVNDDLVFGYDTGYGVADNNTATRFYPGGPTVNLVTNGDFSNGSTGWNYSGSGASYSEFTTFQGRSVLKANGLTNYNDRGYLYQSINVTSGQTYTVSFNYYLISGQLTYDPDSANNSNSTFTSPTSEWKTHTHTFTAASSNLVINLWGINGNPGYWYITDIQCEQKTHRTPFVNGTRSSTQSLIDLKRNTNINLSNVSFNSTGQPTFDGTDDYIDLANNPQAGETTASWEFVVKFDVTHDDDTSTYRQLYIQEASVWIAQYYDYIGLDIRKDNNAWFDGNGGRNTTSKIGPVDANIWYHVVFTFNNGVMKGYLNGVLGFTTTKSGMTQGLKTGTTPRRIGRRSGQPLNGDIPVVKMYDKDLSASEVKQNYNAYKNRFDL